MKRSVYRFLSEETVAFFKFKKSERRWHIPLLASLCVGLPLFLGLYFDKFNAGAIASLAGTVILYLPTSHFSARLRTMFTCSFGFMVSAMVGLVFGFNPFVAATVLGLFAFSVQWVCLYFRVKPPGSFFFIMIASIAVCMPFKLGAIPEKVGLIGMGATTACLLALVYSALTWKKNQQIKPVQNPPSAPPDIQEITRTSAILGGIIFIALLLGYLLQFQNPYWVPVSSAAVMQGGSTYHIWERSIHRILGTFVGVAICWMILTHVPSLLGLCLAVAALQFIVEILVVRHYALAVIFITPLTILLTEASNPLLSNPDILILTRFWSIALGSLIGALGGWLTYRHSAQ